MNVPERTVVIVDDEEEVVASLRRTLRHENYAITTFVCPLKALTHLETCGGADLLLADIDMPEMTGIELVASARRRWPDMARVLLTGDSSLDSAVAAINEGAVHKYLTKPWSSSELRDCLRDVLATVVAERDRTHATRDVLRARAYQATLAREHPGFTSVDREGGAYVIHDMRTVERLRLIGCEAERLRAAQWMSLAGDETVSVAES